MFHRNSDDAKWRVISGIKVGFESSMPMKEMRAALGKLFKEVERMMVEEMSDETPTVKRYSVYPNGWDEWEKPFTFKRGIWEREEGRRLEGGEVGRLEAGGTGDCGLEARGPSGRQDACALKEEPGGTEGGARTFLWDPVRAVCLRLEISQSMLSQLSKMYSGMSVKEIGDRLRAKKLKPLFWGILQNFTRARWSSAGTMSMGRSGPDLHKLRAWTVDDFKLALWTAWKAFKRSNEFDKEVWAHECGFVSYARMRRGCMLEYGLTPELIERQIVEEIAHFYWAAEKLKERCQLKKDSRIPPEERPQKPYGDEWAKIEYLFPEWTRRMVLAFGVDEYLIQDGNE